MLEPTQQVLGIREQMLADDISRIAADLENPAENKLNAIPESHFKEIFLPMFMGQVPQDQRGINYSTWVHLVGGCYNEMAIVNDKNHNEVLFTVPPLFVYSDFDYLRKQRDDPEAEKLPSISAMAHHAELLGFSRPAEAQAFVMNVMMRYRNSRINLQDMVNYLSRWAEIAKRYDYKLTDVAFLSSVSDILDKVPTESNVANIAEQLGLGNDDFEEA